jgi:hypothetical protein
MALTAASDRAIAVTGSRWADVATMLFENEPRVRLNTIREGVTLKIHWPQTHTGFQLQSQTGGISSGGVWTPVPGSAATNSMTVPIDLGTSARFFRLNRF